MSDTGKPLRPRDVVVLESLASGVMGEAPRNDVMRAFKRAGAKVSPVHGELAVKYDGDVISMAPGSVYYGMDNTFSRELTLMAKKVLERHNT